MPYTCRPPLRWSCQTMSVLEPSEAALGRNSVDATPPTQARGSTTPELMRAV
jgi:hypothetical protein